jgi:hypothetical protein
MNGRKARKRSSAERVGCSTTAHCLAAAFSNIDWGAGFADFNPQWLDCPRLGVRPFTPARNMTLSPRNLIEPAQGLDVVDDVRDAVHRVQHHHVSA